MRCLTSCVAIVLLASTPSGAQQADSPQHDSATTATEAGSTAGNDLVANVLLQLERREQIAANVLLQGSLGGRQLQMGGPEFASQYFQQWDGNREKLLLWCELRGHIDDTLVSWRQVSDGDRLWTDRTTPAGRQVTRVDLRHVRRDLDEVAESPSPLRAGQAGVLPIQLELLSERGGLPTLIAELNDHFTFTPPMSLKLADVPVAGVIGTWKPGKLAELYPASEAGDQSADPAAAAHLPLHIPASVLLLVGQDDLFPYIIEFRSSETAMPVEPADMSQYQLQNRPLLLIHFYERSFSVELDASKFEYSPGEAEWVDLTAARLARLRRDRQQRTASEQSARGATR